MRCRITDAQADAIWERLLYEGPFESIYEVGDLPGFDAQTLAALRDRVRVNPPRPADARIERIEDAYYRIETLGTEEGTNVGLVDEWIDRLMEPLNVNEASLDELMDLQNVSPADAVAIYQQVQRQGGIRGSRDLAGRARSFRLGLSQRPQLSRLRQHAPRQPVARHLHLPRL